MSDFSSLYAAWFRGVLQWTKALGVRSSDKYDVAQNVFVIVHRRLPDCDRRNIAGWLYRITTRQVRDYRRQRWNQSYFKGHEPVSRDIPSRDPTPAMSLDTREAYGVLSNFLAGLSALTRSTFVLFELYGFTCEEVAALHNTSTNTTWARLRRARKTGRRAAQRRVRLASRLAMRHKELAHRVAADSQRSRDRPTAELLVV